MDGKSLLYQLEKRINEADGSSFLDDRTTYEFLNEAAVELVRRTKCLHSSTTITTVADQRAYDLPADFLEFIVLESGNGFKNTASIYKVKMNDGTSDHWIPFADFEEVLYTEQSTSQAIPNRFTIRDETTQPSRVTGTAYTAGAASLGECLLTVSGTDLSDISVGDVIHNTTDGSTGYVLERNSAASLYTSLFGGTGNDWTAGDSFVVQPEGRMQVYLDPPPSTAGYTITVNYIKRPDPVYADYRAFRFPSQYQKALVYYAAWLYKYRDRQPNFGDAWYMFFVQELGRIGASVGSARVRQPIKVNMKRTRR